MSETSGADLFARRADTRLDAQFYLDPLHFPLKSKNGDICIATADCGQKYTQWLRTQYGTAKIFSTPAKEILAAIEQTFRAAFRARALGELRDCEPQFSASQVVTRGQMRVFAAIAILLLGSLILVPRFAGLALIVLSGIAFFMNAAFRAVLLWVGADERPIVPEPPPVADCDLPMYSILVPLFREANVLPALIRALRALDYPGILAQTPQEVNPHRA